MLIKIFKYRKAGEPRNRNFHSLSGLKFGLALFFGIFLYGCSSTQEIIIQDPAERLENAIKLYNDEDYLDAVNQLEAIILQYPGNPVIDDAQYYLGMARFKRGEYIIAAYEFSRLIKNMTASEFVPQAQFMLAESYYQLSPHFALDQKYTEKAIEEFQAYIDFFPTSPKVLEAEKKIAQLNEKLAHKLFNSAYIYRRLDDYKAALLYYQDVIETYHDTKYAPLALYNRIEILLEREQAEQALEEMEDFLKKYPNDEKADEIRELKLSYQNKLSASR